MKIAVYCSSRQGLSDEYTGLAFRLGQWLATRGHTLVYGGVNRGLMHEVARGCHDGGGHIIGVNIKQFEQHTDPLAETVFLTDDLSERKSKMYELAELFVVLPGGLGTVDEWMATLSQLVVDGDNRQIVVANLHGMYDPLLDYLGRLARSPFARDQHLKRLAVANTEEDFFKILAANEK